MKFSKKLFLLSFFALVFALNGHFATMDAIAAENGKQPYEMGAQKASIPPQNTDNVKITIHAQLDAIKKRDAHHAYALMTSRSGSKYDNENDFLSRMRLEFGPIYNHMNAAFLSHYETGKTSVQKVEMQDRYSGEKVTVIYKLIRQNSGHWLIDSFAILPKRDGQPI